MSGIGPKLQQVIDLRLRRYEERGPGRKKQPTEAAKVSKPIIAPVEASAPQQETTTMKKAKKTKAKRGLHPAIKSVTSTGHKTTEIKIGRSEASANLKAAKKAAPKKSKPTAARTTVPAIEIAAFMARPIGATPGTPGGASMSELVAEFGIEAHPMRAKIHYVRHKLGWNVETKDGRYHATAPKAA